MTTRATRPLYRAAALICICAAAVGVAACGDDDNEDAPGNGTDVAFIDEMVLHHESAILMGRIAQTRGQSAFVKRLADDIVIAQQAEVEAMHRIKTDLEGIEKTGLGLASHEAGMEAEPAELETARPFDREFIDMMIPHHQGAIRMARVQLSKGKNAALNRIANDIIAAQSREISAMNEHRKKEFGAASPAGGIPAEPEPEEGAEHSGGHGESSRSQQELPPKAKSDR